MNVGSELKITVLATISDFRAFASSKKSSDFLSNCLFHQEATHCFPSCPGPSFTTVQIKTPFAT
jgi:hypothetical protein